MNNNDSKLKGFFFEPNGGGPKFENFAIVGILGCFFAYYMWAKNPSQEITYMNFVN